ncbi:MAG TPA: hypothetical protein VNJ07_10705, partial [Chitinophagales bacterium]|nr:hypothetical protein [Chitinophagales bacterium]
MKYSFTGIHSGNEFLSVSLFTLTLTISFSLGLYAQKDTPCECARRWDEGAHWNANGTINDNSNAPAPHG